MLFNQGYNYWNKPGICIRLNSNMKEMHLKHWMMQIALPLMGSSVVVDRELERTLPGWIPRRFGGGFGGKKESGQIKIWRL